MHKLPKKNPEYLEWYKGFFEQAKSHQKIGEDSTTYLSSKRAAKNIYKVIPKVKMIFVLRNPVDRAYSHYWHRVRSKRALFGFEKELKNGKSSYIERGFYKRHIDRFYEHFDEDQIKIVIFERLVKNTLEVLNEVCSFLGVKRESDIDLSDKNKNRGKSPLLLRAQLLINYLSCVLGGKNSSRTPLSSENNTKIEKLCEYFFSSITYINLFMNELYSRKYPEMSSKTKSMLRDIYKCRNEGLGEYTNEDLSEYWDCI